MFGAIARFASKSVGKVAKTVLKNPLVKSAVTTVLPGASVAYTAYDAGRALLGGGKSASLPALPASASMPALPMPGTVPGMGQRSIFRDDPNLPAAYQQFAIPERELRTYFRAPKGFVVLRDPNGQAFGVPKQIARQFGWKPAKKPPISVGDWRAVQRADRTVKKMRKIFRQTTVVDKGVSGGKVTITRRKKCS